MTKTIVVIDGDIVAFRCAASNEKRSIKATHKTTGQEIVCAHRTAFKEQIRDVFQPEEFDIVDVQTAEDISHAIHGMKTTVAALKKSCNADEVEIYLSGKNNFRDSLPLPTKYKDRGGIKPTQLKECRKYLQEKMGAVIIDNYEVDDKLAMRCHEGLQQGVKTIAATIDGDQNGVAGWMYNWNKHSEPFLVQGFGEIHLVKDNKDFDGYGRKFFYAQWVLGDSVDVFKPCEVAKKKFGVVSMYNLLKDCTNDKEAVQAVYNQYKSWYCPNGCEPVMYIDWQGNSQSKTLIELMDMYAACAHMLRWEGDVFNTEALLDKLGITY